MIDANLLMRTWLTLSDPANPIPALMASLIAQGSDPAWDLAADPRIYAGRIPVGFDPTIGPGVVILVGGAGNASGGGAHPEIPIIRPRMQIAVWANVGQYQIARQVYRAIFDWIHGETNVDLGDVGFVMTCLEAVEGQDLTDAKTSLAHNISFWQLMLRAS